MDVQSREEMKAKNTKYRICKKKDVQWFMVKTIMSSYMDFLYEIIVYRISKKNICRVEVTNLQLQNPDVNSIL